MRKLIVGTFVSLDGVMQGPGSPDEDRENGFAHGGWLPPYLDEQAGRTVTGWTVEAGAVLLGRKTYQIFAAYWPNVTDEQDPVATKLNSVQKYVASRTLDTVEWNNSTLLEGDAADAVAQLKRGEGGDIHVTGSGDLIQTLLRNDLVDEIRLLIFPVLIGSGKRLFAGGTIPRALRLVNATTTDSGVAIHTYERVGELAQGSI
jgi:dihydrofolate reductase